MELVPFALSNAYKLSPSGNAFPMAVCRRLLIDYPITRLFSQISVTVTHVPATHIPVTDIPVAHIPVTHIPLTHIPVTHILRGNRGYQLSWLGGTL